MTKTELTALGLEAETIKVIQRPAGAPHSASKLALILGLKWKVGQGGTGFSIG